VQAPDNLPAALPADRGLTVTRRGLAAHLLARAQTELDAGRPQQAAATIEKALELEPHDVEALVAAGVLLGRQGHLARARSLLDRALGLAPEDVLALTARGALELGDGSPYSATRYFERAHGLGKTALTAANLGGARLQLGDLAGTAELLRGLAGPQAPPELHANLAFAELGTGNVALAREGLRLALAAGGDARNPRLVALDALVTAAEKKALAALAARAPAADGE